MHAYVVLWRTGICCRCCYRRCMHSTCNSCTTTQTTLGRRTDCNVKRKIRLNSSHRISFECIFSNIRVLRIQFFRSTFFLRNGFLSPAFFITLCAQRVLHTLRTNDVRAPMHHRLCFIFSCAISCIIFFWYSFCFSVIIDHLHVHWTFECWIGRYIKLDFYPFVRSFVHSWTLGIIFSLFFFGHWNWFRISSHVLISLLLCPFATLICSIDVVPTGLQSLLPNEFRPISQKELQSENDTICDWLHAAVRYFTSSSSLVLLLKTLAATCTANIN